ncbi:MAG: hypothetical protein H0X24_24815 [Ktedonobacterales bacterium]|nr:hypothetical protein [Ktedonobacterales bacterium]
MSSFAYAPPIPYLGGAWPRGRAALMVEVDGAFLMRCFARWRALPSLREAARQISVISPQEAQRRTLANGNLHDMSGLTLSHESLSRIDRALRREQPVTLRIGAVPYFLLCAWMGESVQHLSDERTRQFFVTWKQVYDDEQQHSHP